MKIGRNEPCPCGSGRKYKMCCLRQGGIGQPARRERTGAGVPSPIRSSAAISRKFPLLTPYTVTKIVEDPQGFKDPALRKVVEENLRVGWTIAKVAALSTEEIETKVRALGVGHSRKSFIDLASERESAWSIAEDWCGRHQLSLPPGDEDFLGLAACELWKRFLPDRPSMEMIDDWMQDGYDLDRNARFAEACDVWWKVWSWLRPRFGPGIRRMEDGVQVFRGQQSVFNWCQDFETSLVNAAIHNRRYAGIGRTYVQDWLAQFTEQDALLQANFHHALAEFHGLLGDPAAGEAALLAAVKKWPGEPWAHIHLADGLLGTFKLLPGLPRDEARARTHLERALSLAKNDPHLQDTVRQRLRDIPPLTQALATGQDR